MTLDTASYTARISSASQVQLCIITYEILLECIDYALSRGENEAEDYLVAVDKARQAMQTLMNSLDMGNEIAKELFPLYVYADKLLVGAYFTGEHKGLHEARSLMEPLLSAYREAEASDVPENIRQPMLKTSQQLYAGLTYTAGKLDEYVDQDISRGFKA